MYPGCSPTYPNQVSTLGSFLLARRRGQHLEEIWLEPAVDDLAVLSPEVASLLLTAYCLPLTADCLLLTAQHLLLTNQNY